MNYKVTIELKETYEAEDVKNEKEAEEEAMNWLGEELFGGDYNRENIKITSKEIKDE